MSITVLAIPNNQYFFSRHQQAHSGWYHQKFTSEYELTCTTNIQFYCFSYMLTLLCLERRQLVVFETRGYTVWLLRLFSLNLKCDR
ncbi:hypothetical protein FKM82_016683 [Ascaphus truei]